MLEINYNAIEEIDTIIEGQKKNNLFLHQIDYYGKVLTFSDEPKSEDNPSHITTEEKVDRIETALMETTVLLVDEQIKNQQNEQAIMELSILVAGGN